MSAVDRAVEAIAMSFGDSTDDVYEAMENTLSAAGYEPFLEHVLRAIPLALLAEVLAEETHRRSVRQELGRDS